MEKYKAYSPDHIMVDGEVILWKVIVDFKNKCLQKKMIIGYTPNKMDMYPSKELYESRERIVSTGEYVISSYSDIFSDITRTGEGSYEFFCSPERAEYIETAISRYIQDKCSELRAEEEGLKDFKKMIIDLVFPGHCFTSLLKVRIDLKDANYSDQKFLGIFGRKDNNGKIAEILATEEKLTFDTMFLDEIHPEINKRDDYDAIIEITGKDCVNAYAQFLTAYAKSSWRIMPVVPGMNIVTMNSDKLGLLSTITLPSDPS